MKHNMIYSTISKEISQYFHVTLLSSVQGGVCNLPVPQVRSHLCSDKCQSYVSQDSNGLMDPLMEKKEIQNIWERCC